MKEKIHLLKKAGGSVINHSPVFSYNSKTLYLGCGSLLKSFSTATGEHIQDFEIFDDEEGSKIVGISAHPFNGNVLVICLEDGSFITWSFETNHAESFQKLEIPKDSFVESMGITAVPDQFETFDIITSIRNSENPSQMKIYIFSHNDCSLKFLSKLFFDNGRHSWSVTGPNGKGFIAAIKGNRLTVIQLKNFTVNKHILIGNNRQFSCVACHPTDECVAAGDNTGRILLYYDFLIENKNSPHHVFHWHTLPVNVIAFSEIGNTFYSGGNEHVLVKWNRTAPELRHFLPRISAPIVHLAVSPENEFVAVSTTDNGILIVDAQQHIKCCIQQFTWGFDSLPGQKLFPCGLVVDSRSNCLVTNGRPGNIQFYSTQYSSIMYNMDIVGQNYVSQERTQFVANTEVVALQFSLDGVWLATSQIRDDPEFYSETSLKFWWFNPKIQTYTLNSCITSYHKIPKIIFQPFGNEGSEGVEKMQYLAVTVCDDKKFRIWTQQHLLSRKQFSSWNCDSIGYYRDHPLYDICFSSDGSLLGAAFGPCFTIWDVETNSMKYSLARGSRHLRNVSFGHDDCSFIAVSTDNEALVVWNLLSLSILWVFELNASLLVTDQFSGHIAVFTHSNDLFVFKLTSPDPVYRRDKVCLDDTSILSATFFRSDQNAICSFDNEMSWLYKSALYFFTSKQELIALETRTSKHSHGFISFKDQSPLTPFHALLANQKTSEVKNTKPKQHLQLGVPWAQALNQFSSPPAHTMPPVHLLCGPLLQSFVVSK